ncbi:MAG: hypothetical protein AAGA43_10200 [Bacteroidota bacterium]
MQLIYKNELGAVYKVQNSPNPECTLQLILDSVGVFMSREDIEHLLGIVQQSFEPCHCPECGGKRNKIWCTNPIADVCIKVDKARLSDLEDLIKGYLFTVDMETTLRENNLIPEDHGNS